MLMQPRRKETLCPITGRLSIVEFYKGRRLHREDGPARVIYDSETGNPSYEEWCQENQLHRDDGPAVIEYENGKISKESWYQHGKLGRLTDDPTRIIYDPATGGPHIEEWMVGKKLHRENGPAHIFREYGTGLVLSEEWFFENKLHRKNAPARIYRDRTQDKTFYIYYTNGKLRGVPRVLPGLHF